jgi:hypothetical protein
LLYIAASVEQYCDITQVNALPENEGILEGHNNFIEEHIVAFKYKFDCIKNRRPFRSLMINIYSSWFCNKHSGFL